MCQLPSTPLLFPRVFPRQATAPTMRALLCSTQQDSQSASHLTPWQHSRWPIPRLSSISSPHWASRPPAWGVSSWTGVSSFHLFCWCLSLSVPGPLLSICTFTLGNLIQPRAFKHHPHANGSHIYDTPSPDVCPELCACISFQLPTQNSTEVLDRYAKVTASKSEHLLLLTKTTPAVALPTPDDVNPNLPAAQD